MGEEIPRECVLKGHCLHFFADVFEGTAGASTMWVFREFNLQMQVGLKKLLDRSRSCKKNSFR